MASQPSPGSLPRRPLGKTGLEVSILGFGASPLGSVFEDIDEDEGVRAVHEAFNRGINYFDVSPFYGATKAESVLGRALKDLPRSEFVLSTKVGRYGQDEFDFSAERVARSVDESCQRLNVSFVDIVICHDIEFVDLKQIVEETLPALHKLKAAGKVKFVGISGLPLNIFCWVLEHSPPGSIDVVLSYCHYSLNDSSLTALLPLFEEKGVGVINASPLSMGLLAPQGPPSWHPAPQSLKDACTQASDVCKNKGVGLPKLALRFSTANSSISTTLVGMCTRKQVESNIAAVTADSSSMEEETLSDVDRILQKQHNVTWSSGLDKYNKGETLE